MRAEKKFIGDEYVVRLNNSPFFIVTDYKGLTVGQFSELRKRLLKAGAEIHVVKNSIFRISAKNSGFADLTGSMSGQMAVVTGRQDVSAAAKILKVFGKESQKPKIKFGYLNQQRLEATDLSILADLPSIEVLRGNLLGVLNAPATKLVQLLNTPAQQMVRVLQARTEKQ